MSFTLSANCWFSLNHRSRASVTRQKINRENYYFQLKTTDKYLSNRQNCFPFWLFWMLVKCWKSFEVNMLFWVISPYVFFSTSHAFKHFKLPKNWSEWNKHRTIIYDRKVSRAIKEKILWLGSHLSRLTHFKWNSFSANQWSMGL